MEKSMLLKIATILAVIIVIGAVLVATGSDDKDNTEISVKSTLMIRGNADGNYVIDQKDMEVLEAVIASEKTLADHPLADVNGDGEVNDTDRAILQNMIDRRAGTVYVIALDREGNETTVPVQYPLRNIVTYATNMDMPVIYSGGAPYIAGYFSMTYENAQASIGKGAVNLDASSRTIPDASWAKFTKLDADLANVGGIGAFITDYSAIAQVTEKRADDLKAAKIPFMAFKSADAMVECDLVLTLSYLFGEDTEPLGVKYAKLRDRVLSEIESKLESISDDDKNTFIAFNMWKYICSKNSTYATTGVAAGGIYYSDVNNEFYDKYTKDKINSTPMDTVEALSNYTDVDRLVNYRSIDWLASADEFNEEVISTWDHLDGDKIPLSEYFKGFEDRLSYVNNLLPGPAKLAYTAVAIYPNLFTKEWADSVLQECIDMGVPSVQGHALEQLVPYFDYAMYKEAKN